MPGTIICEDCGYESDIFEFTYLAEPPSKKMFALQCPKCNSHKCKVTEREK